MPSVEQKGTNILQSANANLGKQVVSSNKGLISWYVILTDQWNALNIPFIASSVLYGPGCSFIL